MRDLKAQVLVRTYREGGQTVELYREWRPHTDIADAARLADKYRMYVDSRGTAVQARLYPGDQWTRVERDGNPHAWCEAVTLCLAAEGRRMREGGR